MNFCADGETLLTKDIDKYIKVLVELGHYAEIVTNMTHTQMVERILSWDRNLLSHVEFKCSFHYLELKRRGLLARFSDNVQKAWTAGASVNVEITPTDELIPFIEEVKVFSLNNFGALPHLSIARDDRTKDITYLTRLSMDDYDKVWSAFDSEFWRFKRSIFGKKQTDFCYAGQWSAHINMATGRATCCYGHLDLGDVLAHPDQPFPSRPIGKCPIAHCYNGHALMTQGLIPHLFNTRYGDIRDRVRRDGTHWLNKDLRQFFNTKLVESNKELSSGEKRIALIKNWFFKRINKINRHRSK